MKQSERFCKALCNYGKSLQGQRDPDEWDVSRFDNIEFFYGVMFDQGIRADPYTGHMLRDLFINLGYKVGMGKRPVTS